MSDAVYTSGSQEYLRVEVERAFGGFDTADYTGELALCRWGNAFIAATATWAAATWETVDGRDYLRVLLGVGLTPASGTYKVYARLTGATEIPVTRVVGRVTIT
jgi:hypothetical protein